MSQYSGSLVYSVAELQQMLGVSRSVIYECLRAGIIPCLKLGRRYIIPKVAFHKWLEESPWAKKLTQESKVALK
jgi:excisionase family DNA binding protein